MTTQPLTPIQLKITQCPLCQAEAGAERDAKRCPKCNATATERCFGAIVRGILRNLDAKAGADKIVVAAHRLNPREKGLVESIGSALPTPTQNWSDVKSPPVMDALVRMSGVADRSADVFYSAPTGFDFVPDMSAALANGARVLRGTGIMIFSLNSSRVVKGAAAPARKKRLDPATYKWPADAEVWSVHVGRDWITAELQKLGLTPYIVHIDDPLFGTASEWFLGQRPAT